MSAVTSGGYHATRHVTLKFIPEAATTAQTDSTVTDFIIRFVVKVTEPQRSGIRGFYPVWQWRQSPHHPVGYVYPL